MPKSRFLLWGFKPPSDLVRSSLGSLEQQVLDIVWRRGPGSVRDVIAELPRPAAYTTVMTTLDRLYRKGLLSRTKTSRAFIYQAVTTAEELEDAVVGEVISDLLAGREAAPHPLLSHFVDAVGDHDRELLDELERLVKAKRRRLEKRTL